MICPKCGAKIKDGNVYCQECGKAIQMVPNFEPEIEDRMDETLSGLLDDVMSDKRKDDLIHKEISRQDTKEIPDIKRDVQEQEKQELSDTADKKKKLILFIIGAFIIICAMISSGIYIYLHSYGYYMGKAEKAQEQGLFKDAKKEFEKAYDKVPDSLEAMMGIAKASDMLGDENTAEEMLLKIIDTDDANEEAYAFLIEVYETTNKFEAINELLASCKNDNIFKKYKSYMALPPEFSEEEGKYDSKLVLKLMTDNQGKIYYTTDGSEPTEESREYTAPITLSNGKHVIRAIFVNQNGIRSDSVAKIYEISLNLPKNPVVTPESGTYQSPEYIQVQIPENCTVYYTTDGTLPTQDAYEYTDPLPMPLGVSNFKFIAINEDGLRSDLTDITYNLAMNTACKESEAVNFVIASMTAVGQLQDIDGTALGGSGKYKYGCIGIVKSGREKYFIIEEEYQSKEENDTCSLTGKYYAVDTQTCMLYRATRGEDGLLHFTNF